MPGGPLFQHGAWEKLVRAAHGGISMALPTCAEQEFAVKQAALPPAKRVRIVDPRGSAWPVEAHTQVAIFGDSELVIKWIKAVAACNRPEHRTMATRRGQTVAPHIE